MAGSHSSQVRSPESQVPSPTQVSKSQHFEPQETMVHYLE